MSDGNGDDDDDDDNDDNDQLRYLQDALRKLAVKKWCCLGSNQGPFTPQTDVLTTRPNFH